MATGPVRCAPLAEDRVRFVIPDAVWSQVVTEAMTLGVHATNDGDGHWVAETPGHQARQLRECILEGTDADLVESGTPAPAPEGEHDLAVLKAERCVDQGLDVLVTGEAGTGKSTLVLRLVERVRASGKTFAVTAMTGTAAHQLQRMFAEGEDPPRVHTLHRFLGLPARSPIEAEGDYADYVARHVRRDPDAVRNWRETDVLVVDEVSMMCAGLLDALLDLRSRGEFGRSMALLLVGDFFQLPPVQPRRQGQAAAADPRQGPCFLSDLWPGTVGANVAVLRRNHRVADGEDAWRDLLARVRCGQATEADRATLRNRDPAVVGEPSPDHLHLYPTRAQVEAQNNRRTEALRGADAASVTYRPQVVKVTLRSRQSGEQDITGAYRDYDKAKRMVEQLMRNNDGRVTDVELLPGSRVMVDTNDEDRELVNGALGTVVSAAPGVALVDMDAGGRLEIQERLFESRERDGDTFVCQVRRLPLTVAFAITIHKAQAMTLDRAYVCLLNAQDRSGIFEAGQVYVALSRCRRPGDLVLRGIDAVWGRDMEPDPRVVRFYQRDHSAMPPQRRRALGEVRRRPGATMLRTPLSVLVRREDELKRRKRAYNAELYAEESRKRTRQLERMRQRDNQRTPLGVSPQATPPSRSPAP